MCCLGAGQFAARVTMGVAVIVVAVRLRGCLDMATAVDAFPLLTGVGGAVLMLRLRAGSLGAVCTDDTAIVAVGVLAGGRGIFLVEIAALAAIALVATGIAAGGNICIKRVSMVFSRDCKATAVATLAIHAGIRFGA